MGSGGTGPSGVFIPCTQGKGVVTKVGGGGYIKGGGEQVKFYPYNKGGQKRFKPY